jgi:hypothetical protein
MGNANSGPKREKPFRDALMVAIKAAEADGNPKSLRRVAEKLLSEAATGNVQAIKEVADRLDGKVPQGIVGGDEGDPPLQVYGRIERVLIDPKSAKSES